MKDRFGFDAPKSKPIEESIRWAAQNGFSYIDFQADLPPNDIDSFDIDRVRMIRHLCEVHGIAIGIHSSSAINNAEYVPIMAEAVDQYLFANLDLAARLGCGWLIGHGGYHFGDVQRRRETSVDRMKRLVEEAERVNVVVFFENHNKEPDLAEIHYILTTLKRHTGFWTRLSLQILSGHSMSRMAIWFLKDGRDSWMSLEQKILVR